MIDNNKFKKAYASLIGVAIGDAMGMPVELWPQEKIKDHFGKITDFVSAPKSNEITGGLKAGEVTDDTYLTLILSDIIIKNNGKIIPEKVITGIVNWVEEHKEISEQILGPSTSKAYENYKSGMAITETGKWGTTNGASMKIAPVGIISSISNLEQLVDNVRLACLPTHNTGIAISGAAAIAAAISYGVSGGDKLEELIEIAKKASIIGRKKGFKISGASIARRIELGIDIVQNKKDEAEVLAEIYNLLGSSVMTTESIPAAIALVYLSEGDLVRCVKLAANLGGDTDTIAALGGAICGGFKGVDKIPKKYIAKIKEVNQIDLATRAKGLLKYRN